jgi:predicted PurR-regulated permease PerM
MSAAPERSAAARFLVIAASTVVLIAGLRAAQSLIIPFLLAVFLAIICSPAVIWLHRRRVPRVLAILLVVVALMGVLTGVGALVGGSVNDFIESVPTYQGRLNTLLENWSHWLDRFDVDLPSLRVQDYVNLGGVMNVLGTGLKGLAATLSNTFLIILTTVFILAEATTFSVKLRAAFGDSRRSIPNLGQVTTQVQRYLAVKTAVSLVTGAAVALWTSLLGLDFALVWGLLAFLLNYIPNIGSIIAAVPAVLLATVQLGLGPALLVAAGYLVVNTALGNIVEPALMGQAVGLSTLVVFVSLVFWGWVWGPVGMLLSVPLTMIVKIFLENSDELRWLAVLLDSPKKAQAIVDAEPGPESEPGDGAESST